MNEEQIKFIDKLYKDLYLNDSLKKHTTSKDKYKSIKEYIEFLESIHNKTINHNHIDTLKKMYYDKYVIKEENIPDSYYKHQEGMYLERGYGHVNLGDNEKKELQEQIINDQKKSLDIWLDYFLSNDSNYIPFWAKYWAFSGMLKLGSFNKESGKYTKRTKHTVTKFADLNREALALCIDTLLKYLDKKDINDKGLEQLVKTGSFGSIYMYITNKILSDNTNIIKRNIGKWIKYNKGSVKEAKKLASSLQGYNTGWCTAGESTAISQVCGGDNYRGGDFYVYYTLDENDEYKVPRIAIRMEDDSIGEIRGIASSQNLEPEMEEVVKEKIKDFPDKDKYYKKVNDMKILTKIYKKHNNKELLTKEELIFLYEINDKIEGFGYQTDVRINEILNNRNNKKDLAYLFSVNQNQIATKDSELNSKTVIYYGHLCDRYSKKVNFPNLKVIIGVCTLDEIESAEGLEKLERITRTAFFTSLKDANGLNSLKYVGGDLSFNCLESANGLENLEYIGRIGYFNNLKSLKGLENLEYIGLIGEFNSLDNIDDFLLPKKVGLRIILKKIINLDLNIIPEPLTYEIHLANNIIITPNNLDDYKKSLHI